MRSYDAPSGLIYHHNGDYSGDVKIAVPMCRPGETYSWGQASDKVVEIDEHDQAVIVDIPFEDMKRLVLNYYRSELISRLEQSDEVLEQFLFGYTSPKERA